MDDASLWLLVLAGLLVGALAGAVGAAIALRRGDGASAASRRELSEYRDEVAAHYAETARRVDALTHAYKAVYDHLEEGAYRLVGEDELKRRLDDASRDPVTLEGIGRRALDASDDADAGAGDDATGPAPERAIAAGAAATAGAAAVAAGAADATDADATDDEAPAQAGADGTDADGTEPETPDPDPTDADEAPRATDADDVPAEPRPR
jgi:uncharacterized membrane-anchored protein YhcB (DUF1043 family)